MDLARPYSDQAACRAALGQDTIVGTFKGKNIMSEGAYQEQGSLIDTYRCILARKTRKTGKLSLNPLSHIAFNMIQRECKQV
jgi:hypothetical protein